MWCCYVEIDRRFQKPGCNVTYTAADAWQAVLHMLPSLHVGCCHALGEFGV